MKKDISFYDSDTKIRLNIRVSALIQRDDEILLQKNDDVSYHYLIGGRICLGEDSLTAIKREVEEETGILLKDDECKLLDTIENFFVHEGVNFHEILFVYKVENKELLNKKDFKTLDKDDSYNYWIKIEDLDKIELKPEFIKDMI